MRGVRRVAGVALAAVAAAWTGARAQEVPDEAALRALVTEHVEGGLYAGLAVGVVARDGTRRIAAHGPAAGVTPFDERTVFEIGSITKAFTGALLAEMASRGEVELEDPVARHLPPGARVPARDGREITLLDLATHTSGLPRLPANLAPADPRDPYADYGTRQLLDFLATHEPAQAAGTRFAYSNLGTGLLGVALAHRAGTDYGALVHARLLAPLGLGDTRIELTAEQAARLAPGHDESGARVAGWRFDAIAAAGALRSTLADMLRWVAVNADPASHPLGPVLASAHAARRPADGPGREAGLGWQRLQTPSGRRIVWHNGGTGGYRSFIGFDETTGLGVVVLANTARSVDALGLYLLDPARPRPSVRRAVTLPPEALEAHVGTYRLGPDVTVTVTREATRLFAQMTGQPRRQLFAASPTMFFLRAVEAEVEFLPGADGRTTAMVLRQGGRETRWERQ